MDRSAMFDAALDKMMSELDDIEGSSAMSHSAEECPDPLTCSAHDSELGDALSGGDKEPAVSIEVHKMGLPSLDGAKMEEGDKAEELGPDEVEALRKLLKA